MYNCIFTAHCIEPFCDKSCPALVETSYLLERNEISMDSEVFRSSDKDIKKMLDLLDSSKGSTVTYVVPPNLATSKVAELLTYCAICTNWKGNQLHCNVYNLKFSKYLDDLKKSWSLKSEPESLEYSRIWCESSKILIISNIDYISFGDFESQTLLNILQSRLNSNFTTIVISPQLSDLVGKSTSMFFNIMKRQLSDSKIKVST